MSLPDVWAEVGAYLDTQDAGRSREIGPSDAKVLVPGRGCVRQLAYRVQGYEPTDPVPPELVQAAALGKAIHGLIAAARRSSGQWTAVQEPLEVPGFRRPGEPDAYSLERAHLDDVKTVSDRVYAAVLEAGKRRDEDARQLEVYGSALEMRRQAPAVLSATYVRRSDGATWVDSWSYDPDEAGRSHLRLLEVVRAVSGRKPIEFGRVARSPADRPCDSCVFRTRCWGSLTTARTEPAPPPVAPVDVQEAARRYHAAVEVKRAAEDVLSDLRPVLLAHAGQTFTDDEGQERRIKVTPGHAHGGAMDQRRVRDALERWGEPVPTLGTADRLSLPAATEKRGS